MDTRHLAAGSSPLETTHYTPRIHPTITEATLNGDIGTTQVPRLFPFFPFFLHAPLIPYKPE